MPQVGAKEHVDWVGEVAIVSEGLKSGTGQPLGPTINKAPADGRMAIEALIGAASKAPIDLALALSIEGKAGSIEGAEDQHDLTVDAAPGLLDMEEEESILEPSPVPTLPNTDEATVPDQIRQLQGALSSHHPAPTMALDQTLPLSTHAAMMARQVHSAEQSATASARTGISSCVTSLILGDSPALPTNHIERVNSMIANSKAGPSRVDKIIADAQSAATGQGRSPKQSSSVGVPGGLLSRLGVSSACSNTDVAVANNTNITNPYTNAYDATMPSKDPPEQEWLQVCTPEP